MSTMHSATKDRSHQKTIENGCHRSHGYTRIFLLWCRLRSSYRKNHRVRKTQREKQYPLCSFCPLLLIIHAAQNINRNVTAGLVKKPPINSDSHHFKKKETSGERPRFLALCMIACIYMQNISSKSINTPRPSL